MKLLVLIALFAFGTYLHLRWQTSSPSRHLQATMAHIWRPSLHSFTIHGLWPDKVTECGPYNIDFTTILTQNQPLIGDLTLYWPSDRSSHIKFWTHEWKKHGTCLQPYTKPEDMYLYFNTALYLHHTSNILARLELAGINPGGNYTRAAFVNALTVGRSTPILTCTHGNLLEIRFIYNLTLVEGRVISQTIEHNHHSSCPANIKF